MNISDKILAGRYAKAYLGLEREYSPAERANAEKKAEEFSLLIGRLRPYDKYFLHPALPASVKLDILGMAEKTPSRALNFVSLLVKEGRYSIADLIGGEMREIIDGYSSVSRGTVESRDPIGEEAVRKLEKALSRFRGKKAVLASKRNPEIAGGFRIKMGDFFADVTLNGRLRKLKKELRNL